MKTNTGKFNSDMIRQWSNLIAILACLLYTSDAADED